MRFRKIIEVTQDHIDKAIPMDSSHCMIADAIKEQVEGAKRVSVDLATIRFTIGEKRYIFLTPPPAQEGLLKFDNGVAAPFRFRIHDPAQIVKANDRGANAASEATVAVGRRSGRGGRAAPVRHGGQALPMGPLPGGAGGAAVRTGKMRRFGLQRMGRVVDEGEASQGQDS